MANIVRKESEQKTKNRLKGDSKRDRAQAQHSIVCPPLAVSRELENFYDLFIFFSLVRVLFILCSREREARCFCYNRVAGCRGSIRSSLLLCLYSKVLARGEHFQISY